jgi:hypothetical protein
MFGSGNKNMEGSGSGIKHPRSATLVPVQVYDKVLVRLREEKLNRYRYLFSDTLFQNFAWPKI